MSAHTAHLTVTVYVDEEYGYRSWVWETGMTAEELVAWWTGLETVMSYFFSPSGLPGTMTQVHLGAEAFAVHETNEPIPFPAGYHYKDDRPRDYWKAHMHIEEDSFLQAPDGTYHRHLGHPNRET
ncbi:hypothetical protein N9917_03570 [Deltaproteobacteria bacterium]|nr:hypothetical protein [Deltaproteobacteria bacterium]